MPPDVRVSSGAIYVRSGGREEAGTEAARGRFRGGEVATDTGSGQLEIITG